MAHQRCAVVGVGQTHHRKVRDDVSMVGLVREAAERALADAECTWSDIDALVIGKAPDAFEGVIMPELFLADALGCAGKPMLRVHTAGSVGGSTLIVGSHLVTAGRHDRVLVLSWEKQSEGNAQWGLAGGRSGGIGAGGAFAPWMRAYIAQSGAPDYIGWMVAVKDRLNALKNPYAHLKIPDITIDKVRESVMLWDPIRFLESCPSSDGACAVVISDEDGAKKAAAEGRAPAWILGASSRSEPPAFPGRDPVRPEACLTCAEDVYRMAGITRPREQLDMAELYVPFSWHEPMWLEAHYLADVGEGWKLVDDGSTEIGGSMPINCSGGVLSSNPIGASGLLRFAEAANQVRGMAGEHQVDGAKTALGMAYGANSQYFSMWVVASSLQPFG